MDREGKTALYRETRLPYRAYEIEHFESCVTRQLTLLCWCSINSPISPELARLARNYISTAREALTALGVAPFNLKVRRMGSFNSIFQPRFTFTNGPVCYRWNPTGKTQLNEASMKASITSYIAFSHRMTTPFQRLQDCRRLSTDTIKPQMMRHLWGVCAPCSSLQWSERDLENIHLVAS